jgi:hypothetical protein
VFAVVYVQKKDFYKGLKKVEKEMAKRFTEGTEGNLIAFDSEGMAKKGFEGFCIPDLTEFEGPVRVGL